MDGSDDPSAARRSVVRLVVPSPDRERVLARPNGLAGWALPAIPARIPLDEWTTDAGTRAAAIIGAPVEPLRRLAADAWAVTTVGRVSAAGSTWIRLDDAARLGADEALVRRWADAEGHTGHGTQDSRARG